MPGKHGSYGGNKTYDMSGDRNHYKDGGDPSQYAHVWPSEIGPGPYQNTPGITPVAASGNMSPLPYNGTDLNAGREDGGQMTVADKSADGRSLGDSHDAPESEGREQPSPYSQPASPGSPFDESMAVHRALAEIEHLESQF